jgi:WD40 repeat protein
MPFLRLSVAVLLTAPLVASAQPPDEPPEPLFRPVPKLPEGAVMRVGDSPFALSGSYNAVVLSPDGKRIAAGLFGVAVYDADSGLPLRRLTPTGGNTIYRLTWSSDGRHLLVFKFDDGLRIWDTTNGTQLWDKPLKSPQHSWTRDARFIAKDKLVVLTHLGPQVEVFDVATGKLREPWTVDDARRKQFDALGEGYEPWQVALSPSGELMAWLAVSEKGNASGVLIYETESGKLLHTIKGLPYTTALDMPDEGKSLVLHPVPAKPGDKNPPRYTVVGLPDGRAKYQCAYRGTPLVYDKKMVSDGWDLKNPIYAPGTSVTIHRDVLHLRDREGIARWDFATGKKLGTWDQEFGRFSVSADGKRMLLRTVYCARIVDGDTDAIRTSTHFWNPPSIRYLADGKLRAEEGGRVHLWDPKTNTTTVSRGRMPKDHREEFAHLEVAPQDIVAAVAERTERAHYPTALRSTDGKRVIYGVSDDKDLLVRWFDDATGKELGRHRVKADEWFRHSWLYTSGWFDDEGTVFGYVAPDSRLVRVECATGKVLPPIGVPVTDSIETRDGIPAWNYWQAGSQYILAMRYIHPALQKRPDGQEYRLLDRNGQLVRQFRFFTYGHNFNQRGVVSPDGRVIAVRTLGGNVRLYETATGGRLWPYDLEPGTVAFSPDGKFLATTDSYNPSVLVWDLDRIVLGPKPPAVPKTAKEAEALWEALNDEDPKVAIPAGRALAGAPDLVVELLKDRLRGPEAKQLDEWIAKLASEEFAEREAAEKELARAGDWAVPAMRAALKNPASPEQKRRLESLHAGLNPKPIKLDLTGEIPPKKTGSIPPYLREVRALEVLERIGTPEAKKVIAALAAGDTGLMATREANRILARSR